MTFPNFLIIGAARSGTSSLYEYMRQHPEIYFSQVKEPMFFAFPEQKVNFKGPGDDREINIKAVTDPHQYGALFAGATGHKAIGEASANYLYSETAAKTIKQYIPDVKLIAILRNPAERAYSSYLYTVRDAREQKTTFEEALAAESERIGEGWEHIWHYRNMGFYYRQLVRYYQEFPSEQIKVFLQDDLNNNPESVLKEIFKFLSVDADFTPDLSLKYNQGGVPKNKLMNRLLTHPSAIKRALRPLLPKAVVDAYVRLKHKNLDKVPLEQCTKEALIREYENDIRQLSALIDRDLSAWLVP